MKFGEFMSYSKANKNSTKTSSRLFCVCKELSSTLLEYEIFEAIYLYYICNSKAIKVSPNQHAGFLRLLFTEDSLNIKKGLGLVSRSLFSYDFFIKMFIL